MFFLLFVFFYLHIQKKCSTFAAKIYAEGEVSPFALRTFRRGQGVGLYILVIAFIDALCLVTRKLRNLSVIHQIKVAIDAYGYDIMVIPHPSGCGVSSYQRRFLVVC